MLNDLSEIEKSEPLDGSLYEQNGGPSRCLHEPLFWISKSLLLVFFIRITTKNVNNSTKTTN